MGACTAFRFRGCTEPRRVRGPKRFDDLRLRFAERSACLEMLGEKLRGHLFLLLHGGAGPQSVSAFADRLAETKPARVITPTHPGFGGTSRPEALDSIRGLAAL